MSSTTRTVSLPSPGFAATRTVPGDKSLSHRALIFAGMASGESHLSGLGTGADVRSSAEVLRGLGIEIDFESGIVVSPGVDRWTAPAGALDCGNSGTTLRLMAGALSGRPFTSTLSGDASLSKRPMERLREPLEAVGGQLATTGDSGTPPVRVGPSSGLVGADVTVGLASAQVRSAFELAAVQANGSSTVSGPGGYRDHTERWLHSFGRGATVADGVFRVDPGPIPAFDYTVPGDPSSAAYLWTLAALRPGATVTTPAVSLNSGRTGFLRILESFGASVHTEITGTALGDPIGDVTVEFHEMRPVSVAGAMAVAALDELPLVGVLGSAVDGVSTVTDAAELATKESDRIATTVAMIRGLGGDIEPTPDGFVVTGHGGHRPLGAGTVDANHDHRIAMTAAVAAVLVEGSVTIVGGDVAAVSWPDFYATIQGLWA